MPAHVTSLISDIEKVRKALNALNGERVSSQGLKKSLRELAERYFTEIRPSLIDSTEAEQHISAVNDAMQSLVEMCHKRGMKSGYIDLLRTAKRHLIVLDSKLVSTPLTVGAGPGEKTPADTRVITTLRALVPSAALSYEQALIDLDQPERLSWRGPATDLREALRETLDHLAPDDEVKAAPGYKVEPDARGPTMKQKVRYILKNRQTSKSIAATTEDATKSVDEAIGAFVRSVYTRSSVSTHTPTDKSEVLRVLDLVRVVLCELLEVR